MFWRGGEGKRQMEACVLGSFVVLGVSWYSQERKNTMGLNFFNYMTTVQCNT